MTEQPAIAGSTVPVTAEPKPTVAQRAGALWRSGVDGSGQLWRAGKAGAGEALDAAGLAAERMHRRVMLIVLALAGVLLLGAAFRAWGWAEGNYVLILATGLAALWALASPLHVVGVLLLGGGVAAARNATDARDVLIGYARLLGRMFLAFLIPLVLFAVAPGDASFGTSLKLIALAPVAVLTLWLLGRAAPAFERGLILALPLLALTFALANMLVPERTLATLGVPAWLRADRPQDDELARLETALEKRRNAERAEALRAIRAKIEAGTPLTAEDEAAIAAAQAERVTLTGWVGAKYDAALAAVRTRAATAKAAPVAAALPPAGRIEAPRRGWSDPLAVPAGARLCSASPAGERGYTTQCRPRGGGEWGLRAAGACVPGQVDAVRFRARGHGTAVEYRFVAATAAC